MFLKTSPLTRYFLEELYMRAQSVGHYGHYSTSSIAQSQTNVQLNLRVNIAGNCKENAQQASERYLSVNLLSTTAESLGNHYASVL